MPSYSYGYILVSAIDQNDARQILDMTRYGIIERNLYMDKQTCKDNNRPQYQKLKNMLCEGDVLVVKISAYLDAATRRYGMSGVNLSRK